MGNISIQEVEENILKQANDIYTTRGRTQKIPLILQEINSKKDKIKEIQNNLQKYQDLTHEIEKLKDEVKNIETKLKKFRSEKDMLDNYLKCYDSFVSVITSDKELEALPSLQEYPEAGIGRLNDLAREEKSLNDEIKKLQKGSEDESGIEELLKDIDSISIDSELLKNEDKVGYLKINLEKYKTELTGRSDDDENIKTLNESIRQGLDKISDKWTEQNVTEFTDLISHENKIKVFNDKFEEIESKKRDIDAQQKALQAKQSPVNVKSVIIALSLSLLIGSITAFYYLIYVLGYYLLYVLGGALLLIALIWLGIIYLQKENPLKDIQQRLSKLGSDENTINSEYQDYLEKILDLDKSLLIDSVKEIFRTIEQIKEKINDRNKLKSKQEEQRNPFIKKFEGKATLLQKISDVRVVTNNMEIIVNQIINKFDNDKKLSKHKEDSMKDLSRKQRQLKENQEQFTQLLESIKAKDYDDFSKKYEDNNKIKELIKSRKGNIETIEKIVGLDKSDEVIDFLKKNDKQDIDEEVITLANDISENSNQLTDKITELGKKEKEIEQIEGESELAEVMTELESEKQKLLNAYKDWVTYKIALKILADVKEKYEKEKQPEVIKNSSTYFSRITQERYKRVSVSLDERDVSVFDLRESSKKIEQLSRGTKEQLLISLRLGFIEEYEKKAEPLPVIVDEALVNCDPNRAKRIAEILYEFGENRQILIFTCQPTTTEYFNDSAINLIPIEEN